MALARRFRILPEAIRPWGAGRKACYCPKRSRWRNNRAGNSHRPTRRL